MSKPTTLAELTQEQRDQIREIVRQSWADCADDPIEVAQEIMADDHGIILDRVTILDVTAFIGEIRRP